MINIKVEREHTKGRQEAKQAVMKVFAEDPLNHDLEDKWDNYRCELSGDGINGSILIGADRVVFELNVSILVRTLGVSSQEIEQGIRAKLDIALS